MNTDLLLLIPNFAVIGSGVVAYLRFNAQGLAPCRQPALDRAKLAQAKVERKYRPPPTPTERALNLLEEFLTDAQKETLHKVGMFTVYGETSGLPYLLCREKMRRLAGPSYGHVAGYCVHTWSRSSARIDQEPWPDILLAMKLWIEHDEVGFRAAAYTQPDAIPKLRSREEPTWIRSTDLE